MATLSTTAVRSNSTLANFKQWAQVISNFFTTAGWSQSADTGQVNWGTIASVPAAGSYVYEIWKPGDALTVFYLKVEYGTNTASSSTGPQLRLSVGTGTDGAGNLTGFIAGPFITPISATTVTSTVTQFNCFLSGDSGRMNVAMWVNDTTNFGPVFFGVARSKNSSGTNTSSSVTLLTIGNNTGSGQFDVQTIVFGTGAGNAVTHGTAGLTAPLLQTGLNSNLFASTDVPVSPLFPCVGYYDNPLIEFGCAAFGDITDQATFAISAANTPYGTSHTYIGLKQRPFDRWSNAGASASLYALVMLYE